MAFRRLQARNTPSDSDGVGRRGVSRLLDNVLRMEVTAWKRTIANTGSASSTICGM